MFRRFRHKLFLSLIVGIIASGALGVFVQPDAWRAILICTLGSALVAMLCGRVARRHLHATLGRLRRVADDVGHGRPAATLEANPGDDMYKLTSAVNLLAVRLADAAREEKRLHEQLRRRERLAFLGELAASVAHEVNNPLDGVQNCARILRRSGHDTRRADQMLDLIDGGLERIELIVRRLLTLAREHVVRPTEASVSAIVDSAIKAIESKVEAREITIVKSIEADDDRAAVDEALLEQVFVNLLTNAADSMTSAGMLTVSVRRETVGQGGSDAESFVCVDVADSGEGIPEDVLPHIFEPFFTTKTGGKGTGLGLSIAARIVDAHHGTLSVAPRDNGGTTFTVRIPARPAATVPDSAARTPAATQATD